MNRIIIMILLGGLVCLNSGCSDSKLGYVTGVVTFQGEPLPKATITFTPKEAGGQIAVGISDEKGNYQLTTNGGETNAGALPGDYLMTVSKMDVPIISKDDLYSGKVKRPAKIESLIPVKYNKTETSGLTATVMKGRNTIPIELAE